jgi:hypothetical protein
MQVLTIVTIGLCVKAIIFDDGLIPGEGIGRRIGVPLRFTLLIGLKEHLRVCEFCRIVVSAELRVAEDTLARDVPRVTQGDSKSDVLRSYPSIVDKPFNTIDLEASPAAMAALHFDTRGTAN